jgi:hypothetical protein
MAPATHVRAEAFAALSAAHQLQGRVALSEMAEYAWVSVEDLRRNLGRRSMVVSTSDGTLRELHLRSFVPRALERAEELGLLAAVCGEGFGRRLQPMEAALPAGAAAEQAALPSML